MQAQDDSAASDKARGLDSINVATIVAQDIDGPIRLWSDGCRDLFGWTAEEAIGKPAGELLRTVYPVPFANIRSVVLRDGEWRGKLQYRSKSATNVIALGHIILIGNELSGGFQTIKTVIDVTELRGHLDIAEIIAGRDELEQRLIVQAKALSAVTARFRGVFDSQLTLICVLAPDGTLVDMNQTALEAYGLTGNGVVGCPYWEIPLWPSATRSIVRNDFAEAMRGTLIRREIEILGAGGRMMLIDFSLKAVMDDSTGAVISVIAEGRDLTKKRGLTDQLAQVQKVQALGQLAGGIAHDFNNILQTILGAATLIDKHMDDREKVHHLTGMMIEAAHRGTSITQRLLSFARRGILREEIIDTAELLKNMREVMAHTLGTTIAVHAAVPPSVPSVLADRGQLETALINIAINARDAMPDGGMLIFSAEVEQVADGDQHRAGLIPGDYVRLDVSDDGTGMDAQTLARVTEPFFTTKPVGEGTGLGLAMVQGFIERSGGGLRIASTPHAGTTVSLLLRQAAGREALVQQVNQVLPSVAPGPLTRILIVDDDDLVRETLAAQLEDAGFALVVASSGPEALALIHSGEKVDVLISDLSMPGMNGVTTIQKVRELHPDLPCFLLTGYVGERAALSAENAFTLVRKPVAMAELTAQIKARLEATND